MLRSLLSGAVLLLSGIVVHAQQASELPADVTNDYFKHQLEMIRVTAGFTPPVASRALGYSGLAAYEAVVHGIPERQSLAGSLPDLESLPMPVGGETYHWAEVSNYALYEITAALYSNASTENLDALLAIRNDFTDVHEAQADAVVIAASQSYGQAIGEAIAEYAGADGQDGCQFSNFPEDYVIPEGPGLWEPLPGQMALQPYWGDKRCFVVPFVSNEMVGPEPPVYSEDTESEFYAEALAVYDAVNNVTPEEQNIAEYWADGGGTYTPPGHSISMLRFVLIDEEEDLAFASEAYARLGMALADAFVQCWKTKYFYNLVRPITYINDNIDAEWGTIVDTPPFPEYTSGHSSQSGAFGAVMTELYGPNYAFTDSTYGELYGGPRSWESFEESALETAISRLYGGIHYPVGNNNGTQGGMMIGGMINDLFDQAVSVETLAEIPSMEVFPNPSNGVVNLSIQPRRGTSLVVYNGAGQIVHHAPIDQRRVDLTTLAPGLYHLQLVEQGAARPLAQTRWVKQ